MYKLTLVNTDGEEIGTLLAEHVQHSKSGKAIKLSIGKCTCYKSSCGCVIEQNLDVRIVKSIEEI